MEEYEILGIDQSTLVGMNQGDMIRAIRKQYKIKLDGLIARIREILDKENLSAAEKVEEIQGIPEEMFEFACAFSRIESRIKGEVSDGQELPSVSDEVKSVIEMLQKTSKLSEPKVSKVSEEQPSTRNMNAYQVLAISENDQLTDQKVAIKTNLLLNTAISKKSPFTTDDSEKMLFRAFKYMWAYSKLKTPQLRKDYANIIKYSQMLSYAEVQRAISVTGQETLATTEIENPSVVTINLGEEEQLQLQISERQKLSSSVFSMTTGSVIRYLVKKIENGEITEQEVYSMIDMKRLETDPNYREKIVEILTDGKNIRLAQQYLGGYIGVIKEENGTFNVKYALKHIGLCVQNQRQQRKQRENTDNVTPQQPNGEEGR